MIRPALTILALALPLPVLADMPPLSQVPAVTEGLIAAAIAYEIGEVCGPVDARLLRGLSYLNGLKAEARRLGYSDDQIDAFTDDAAERDRLEGVARERLAALGAVEGQPDTYCDVGRAEIAAESMIGRLLAG